MNDFDWQQLLALRAELANNMMAYDAMAQERFTQLLVMSLKGKGDPQIEMKGYGRLG